MNLSLQNQIIALWVVVILLAGYIIFLQQKRSYYVPGTQTPITMMDLQEYSSLSPQQKGFYVSQLNAARPRLLTSSNNMMMYQSALTGVMNSTFTMSPTGTSSSIPPRFIVTDLNTRSNLIVAGSTVGYVNGPVLPTGNTFMYSTSNVAIELVTNPGIKLGLQPPRIMMTSPQTRLESNVMGGFTVTELGRFVARVGLTPV